jgi:PAS domain S-box-containing protein
MQDEMAISEILERAFKECERVTQSEFTYLILLNRKHKKMNYNLWTVNNKDSFSGNEIVRESDRCKTEIWDECLAQGRPVVKNKYREEQLRYNYYGNELSTRNEFVVPIFEKHKIKALMGVVNKTGDFDQYDMDLIGILADNIWKIFQRKRIEEELKLSEERYRSLFERNSAVVLLFEPVTGNIADANLAACTFYGYSKDALMKMNISDINVYPGKIVQDEIIKVLDLQKNYFTFRHRLANGSERDVELFAGSLILNRKKYIYSIVHDVSDRRIAEKELLKYRSQLEVLVRKRTEELYQSEERFRKLSETSNDLIIRLKNNSKIIYTNPIFSKVTKLPVDQLFLHEINEVNFPRKFKIFCSDLIESVLKTSLLKRREFEYPEKIWIDWLMMPEFGENNEIDSLIAFGRDITERKSLERSIQESLEKEKELNELKTNFISMASHEFRTPLTAILSSADLLELFGRNWDDNKYFEHISKIQCSVEEMISLIDDVLILSSSDKRTLKFDPRKINFRKLCEEIVDSVRKDPFFDHDMQFTYSSQREEYNLDEKLIKQLISNLLINAIKYTPGSKKVHLYINENSKNELEIIVEDEGRGIEETEMGRIFEPFYRGTNIDDKPGTGLGLSIVKKAVDAHKGTLELNSKKDRGTQFKVTLPLIREEL